MMRTNIHARRKYRSSRLAAVASFRLRRKVQAGESGSAMVEFALSAVALLTVSIGILAVSLASYSYSFVSSAARDATRYAIVLGSTLKTDCTAPGYATCVAQPDDIAEYVQQEAFPGIDPSNIVVSATWLNADGTACGTNDTCKVPGNFVNVKVSYPYVLTVPFMPTETMNISATSQMVIAQ